MGTLFGARMAPLLGEGGASAPFPHFEAQMARFAVFVDAGYFWVQAISSVMGIPKGVRANISVDFQKTPR